ncbi:2-succinyl-5-enolpyruvyl-6-hydroxy-3-cyclohexene-1-carboxylic-acid synthase [Barnesiella sp. An55]|uniref:2-succinyl-5-enolpyruvyl-6-hydroxy-3- cyclohexene-1-carboxylic-acid synthase n=1 Tax=Barnesiella sp. An55 TaxID=1965646 RepID=UPI000B39D1A9|nr:2-succinyl-5-enolpyruvyl-6-hydroxy-3-cyclohexene-1-carboxylic-acid synthase [Barnesiella sp. An55]OUN72814.1 2-succinyl-5-enolpyruvyl-6-hydroxy-3-cyclohexene-1-carboxylic-acid synthase [Barnesiella sp. An55]
MKTTDKQGCNALVEILAKQGVKRVVLSPGSRNAPLLMAFSRSSEIESYVVVDERTAAFMALGMSQRSGEPVALVCTSGTALLNYAPAVAEAYYQHIPLIVISGDRPIEWIDQDDGQTLRQYGALSHFVKRSYDLRAEWTLPTDGWYFNRCVNDALLTALAGEAGPVHINLSITEPLTGETEAPSRPERVVMRVPSASVPDEAAMALLCDEFMSARKVLVVAAFMPPSEALNQALSRLAALPQVVVLTESLANVHDERFIPTIDRVYSVIDKSEWPDFAPDLLITLGGSLVSRMIKAFLRQHKPKAHWRISPGDRVVDTLQALTRHIEAAPAPFLDSLLRRVTPVDSSYSALWHDKQRVATRLHDDYMTRIGWCDLKAFSMILPAIPAGAALQLSNGTTVRYAQLFDTPQVSRNDCNRGVCGIDGSTSTAAGAACVGDGPTVFITGDMSFSYDANGLSSAYLSPRFKVIVMCNGGGGIFRFIKPTAGLPELERCFEVHRDIPVEKYADLFGLRYFAIDDEASAAEVLPRFFAESERPAILAVHTPHIYNAEVLRGYFRRARQ